MEEENKNCECKNCNCKKSGSCLTILLLLIIVGLVGFICYDKLIKKDKNNDNKSNSNETSNVESNSNQASNSNTNNDVISSELEAAISKKIASLFNDRKYTSGKSITSSGNNDYDTAIEILKGNLTEAIKTKIVLNNLNTVGQKKITDYKQYNGYEVNYYSTKDFNNKYIELFTGTPTYVDADGCPSYHYNKNSNYYFETEACGYAGVKNAQVYIDSMTKSDSAIQVKIYVGTTFDSATKKLYYKDIAENAAETTKFETITSDNYTNFTSYTLTFESDSNGNYYFTKASK